MILIQRNLNLLYIVHISKHIFVSYPIFPTFLSLSLSHIFSSLFLLTLEIRQKIEYSRWTGRELTRLEKRWSARFSKSSEHRSNCFLCIIRYIYIHALYFSIFSDDLLYLYIRKKYKVSRNFTKYLIENILFVSIHFLKKSYILLSSTHHDTFYHGLLI